MYHPADASESEQAAGITDADDFEFIELINVSNSPIDLTGVQFVQTTVGDQTVGVGFDFSRGAVRRLEVGQSVIVVEDEAAFRLRYGNALPVAGQWSGGLSNGSETLTLMANETIVQQFTYRDAWYAQTDGQGNSLEVVDAISTPLDDYENPQRWRASQVLGGTPGRVGGAPALLGDVNGDGGFDQEDLAQVLTAGKYRTGAAATFEEGDFNGDGVFDSHDIVDALVRGTFQLTGGSAFMAQAGPPSSSRPSSTSVHDGSLLLRPSEELTDRAITELLDTTEPTHKLGRHVFVVPHR
jgi:hypothetical protein